MSRFACLLCLGLLLSSCAPAPPNLTPAASFAWKQHEIQKDLDIIRDLAIDANAQQPPILSTETTRKIVLWHEMAIQLVHDAPLGWKATLLTSLGQLSKALTPAEYQVIAPYVDAGIAALEKLQ